MEQFSPKLGLWLLYLPWLAWRPPRAGTEDVSVQSLPVVRGYQGANVTLLCRLQLPQGHGQVAQVQWQLQGDTPTSVAIMRSTGETHFSNPKRMAFQTSGTATELLDGSLVLRELRVQDEGNYTCEFVMFPQGTLKYHVWLQVLAQPQVQALALPVDIPLNPVPVPLALCNTIGGHPPSNVSWSLPWNISQKAKTSQGPGPLPGTDNVNSSLILIPQSWMDGKNVTCRVEHESFQEPRELLVTLNISYPPEVSILGYDDNWHLRGNEVTLNCDVRSNPEPTSYVWNTTAGSLPPSAVDQGHQLLIRSVDKLVNTTFICSVTNTLGTRVAKKTIQVKGKPGEESASFNKLWLWLIIPVLLLLVIGCPFWKRYIIRCRLKCTPFAPTEPYS
ncbi:poliovirus receptor homolog isoform X2 [Tenrec ecaudatus]|uniref:poliovirus receptor homolog isoform X2 n=1 Tax=Tenrec ecaudatus TaxID=94439 RepID=UPI003F5A7EF2